MAPADNTPKVTSEQDRQRKLYARRADKRSMADIMDDETASSERKGYRRGFAEARTKAAPSELGRSFRAARSSLGPVWAPFVVETALITFREATRFHRAPLPSALASAVVVYGVLSLPQGEGSDVAALIGWGFVLATAYGLFSSDQGSAAAKLGQSLGGVKPATPTPAGGGSVTHVK